MNKNVQITLYVGYSCQQSLSQKSSHDSKVEFSPSELQRQLIRVLFEHPNIVPLGRVTGIHEKPSGRSQLVYVTMVVVVGGHNQPHTDRGKGVRLEVCTFGCIRCISYVSRFIEAAKMPRWLINNKQNHMQLSLIIFI